MDDVALAVRPPTEHPADLRDDGALNAPPARGTTVHDVRLVEFADEAWHLVPEEGRRTRHEVEFTACGRGRVGEARACRSESSSTQSLGGLACNMPKRERIWQETGQYCMQHAAQTHLHNRASLA